MELLEVTDGFKEFEVEVDAIKTFIDNYPYISKQVSCQKCGKA